MKIKNVSGEPRVLIFENVKHDFPIGKWVDVPKELALVLVNQPYFVKQKRPKKKPKKKED